MKKEKSLSRKVYRADYYMKNKIVKITFNNQDHAVIEKIATAQGLTIASFIRLATIEQAKNLYMVDKSIEDQITLGVANMRKIGNNINQIAKYANEQGYTSPDSMEVIFNHLKYLEDEIIKIQTFIASKK